MNKELLIGFLNAIFHGTHIIKDIIYLNSVHYGIFDVYCETESGEKYSTTNLHSFIWNSPSSPRQNMNWKHYLRNGFSS